MTHAGGELGLGIARALNASDEEFYIVGADAGEYQIHIAEVDEKHLVPRALNPDYLPVLKQLLHEKEIDFLWPLHDDEIAVVSDAGDLGVRTFVPEIEAIRICQDKLKSYEAFSKAGVPVPETLSVNAEEDIERAFDSFGGMTWLRATKGAGGRGAFRADSLEEAVWWVNMNSGWGNFTAAEVLTGTHFKHELVWFEGELIATQSRTAVTLDTFRAMATAGSSGQTSDAARGLLVAGAPEVSDETAIQAIKAVSERPHGLFSVDVIGDRNDNPKVTEINVGRFTSVGANYWFTEGFNFPELAVKLAFGEDIGFEPPLINPIPDGTYNLIGRNMDPVYLTQATVTPLQDELDDRLRGLQSTDSPARKIS